MSFYGADGENDACCRQLVETFVGQDSVSARVDRRPWWSSRWAILWAAGFIVSATIAAYGNSLRGPFVFDDINAILENPSIHRLWPLWPAFWPDAGRAAVRRRPVVNVSLAINYAISGENVWSYHALNLAAHVLTALLLFGIVRRTLLLPAAGPRFAAAATPLAATVALFWAVHPLQTEAVTYTIQRTELLAGLFYLLTLYCTIRGASSSRPTSWYAAAAAACMLAMGSKESAASAPLIVLLYDRIFLSASWRDVFRRRWGLYAVLALPLAAIFAAIPYASKAKMAPQLFDYVVGYALVQGGVITHYLRLCFWPSPLVIDYGIYKPQTVWQIVPGVLFIAAILVAVATALRRQPRCGFLGLWIFAILAPSSSVIPIVAQVAAEKRMYLPLAAVVTGVVVGGFLAGQWLVRRASLSLPAARVAGVCLVVFGVTVLGILTFQRNADYASSLSIWQDAVAKMPHNERAWCGLAAAWKERGEVDRAIPFYRKALEISPDYFSVRLDLAFALFSRGQFDEAIDHCRTALKSKPHNSTVHYCLGMALAARRQTDEAIAEFETALKAQPQLAEAHCCLGQVLSERGQIEKAAIHYRLAIDDNQLLAAAHYGLGDALIKMEQWGEAVVCCRRAVELAPQFAEAHVNLGVALAACGQKDEAIAHYHQALTIKPEHAEARVHLGAVLASRGALNEAVVHYEQALKIDPNCAPAHNNLGLTLAADGKWDEAVARYQKALAVKPDYAEAHFNLANAMIVQGHLDQAIAHYRKALEIRPRYVEAKENLDQATSLRQRTDAKK